MGYIVFCGVSTAALNNVIVRKMPSHRRAAANYTEYRIAGRDGVYHTINGYNSMELTCELMLINAPASARQIINAWASGTGQLYTSDDATKYYEASVLKEVKWERDEYCGNFYDIAYIYFECQPFMRLLNEQPQIFTENGAIANLGNVVAYPKIVVSGVGDCTFTIGSETIQLIGMELDNPVTIDCENGYIYDSTDTATTMIGNIPSLPLGSTAITMNSNVAQLSILPRWGWL